MRTDGFVSLHAGWPTGEVVTKPLRVSGVRLLLNYATSAAGSVQVEVQSPDGTQLPGYTLAESAELYGDEIAGTARWAAGDDLSPLRERVVRLRFRLADADLCTMRWTEGEE